MTISHHSHIIQLQGSDLVLPIKGGQIDINETSVPMISGSVTFALPDELEFITQLVSYDPRLNIRAWVTSVQRFGNGRQASVISAEYPVPQTVANITTAWTGYQAKDVSNTYGEPYNSFGMRQSTIQTAELAVQDVGVNFKTMEGTIRLAGREQIAIDYINTSAPLTPSGLTLRNAVGTVLTFIGEVLSSAETDDYVFPVGEEEGQISADALVWQVGQSAWDYMNVLVNASGLRLYADISGIWHLAKPFGDTVDTGTVNYSLSSLSDFNFEVSRQGEWYDGVLLEYEWTDSLDVRHRAFDFSGGTSRVMHVKYTDRIFPGAGAAAAIASRSSKRGVVISASTVSDYFTQVGKTIAVDIGSHVLAGLIGQIQFDLTNDTMSIKTRDSLQTLSINAWIVAPDGYSWDEIVPVIPWIDADYTDFSEGV